MNDAIKKLNAGARFVRGDLHVHSFGGSYDVKDPQATPSAIVARARQSGLSIVALTDHNRIDNVQAFLAAAEPHHDIVAIPAVELSCPEGHLLVYAPTLDALQEVFVPVKTPVVRDTTGETTCHAGMFDVLQRVAAVGGFALLAHVDIASGFNQGGWTPQKKAIFNHEALLGFEVRAWPSEVTYDEDDPNDERKAAGRARISQLGRPSGLYRFARVVNSDSHELDKVGANHAGRERTTRYKMSSLTFEALKIALSDPGGRVRVEEGLREEIPRLIGMRVSGGFLSGAVVRFSPNLTCFIGGRGTGKTTAIRCAEVAGRTGEDLRGHEELTLLDSKAGPDEIELWVQDAFGSMLSIQKVKGDPAQAVDETGDPVDLDFRVDVFRQSESSTLSRRLRDDPGALLAHLDSHIPGVRELLAREEAVRSQLVDAQAASLRARSALKESQDLHRATKSAGEQLQRAEGAKAGAVAELEGKRSGLRQTKARISKLESALRGLLAQRRLEPLFEEFPDLLGSQVKVHDGEPSAADGAPPSVLEAQGRLMRGIDDEMSKWLQTRLQPLLEATASKIAELDLAEKAAAEEARDKREKLQAEKIEFDLGKLKELANRAAKLVEHTGAVQAAKKKYEDAKQREKKLSNERRQLHSQLETVRTAWATRITRSLPKTDLAISLKFRAERYSPESTRIIAERMLWRTNQVPRSAALLSGLGYWGLVDTLVKVLRGGDSERARASEAIRSIGDGAFSRTDADQIVDKLSDLSVVRDLLAARSDCLPELKVRRSEGGGSVRDFSQLSIGQQQSVLLTLLLADDEASAPLLIDQPEDHLDSEFIFKAIVPALRRAKERRQVVLVTHNANVCVLGDAEQIVVLESVEDAGKVVNTGGIDSGDLKQEACRMLEGTEGAFKLRGLMYGMKVE